MPASLSVKLPTASGEYRVDITYRADGTTGDYPINQEMIWWIN